MYAQNVSEARTGATDRHTARRLAERLIEVRPDAVIMFAGIVGTAAIVVFDNVPKSERRAIRDAIGGEFERGLSIRRCRHQPTGEAIDKMRG